MSDQKKPEAAKDTMKPAETANDPKNPAETAKDTKKPAETGGPTAPASVGEKDRGDAKPADNRKGGYGAG